jgi:hypothetical protein
MVEDGEAAEDVLAKGQSWVVREYLLEFLSFP